jgi:hypothetical protein
MKRDLQFAYAAGIVDGEGCLGVLHARERNQYQARVQVVMTNEKPLRILVGLFGGSLSATKPAPNARKMPYHYTASGKNLKSLLTALTPFFIEKRAQADILLALLANVDEWNAKSRQRGHLPELVLSYRESLRKGASELKGEIVESLPFGRALNKRQNLAYLTGILEAEGCFTITKGDGNCFFSSITVQTCCLAVLGELKRTFGGTIISRGVKHANYKPIFMWRVKGQEAADTCRSITPYLSFRHEEVEILRELQNTTNLWAKKVGRGGMPPKVTEQRERWMQRIRLIHNPARAETKSDQPAILVSDSPISAELSGGGPETAAAA